MRYSAFPCSDSFAAVCAMNCCHGRGHRYPESSTYVVKVFEHLLTEHQWKLLSVKKVQPVTSRSYYLLFYRSIIYSYRKLLNRHMEDSNLFLVRSLQLFVALDTLKALCILYTDIKPDSIMFANKQGWPLSATLKASEIQLLSKLDIGFFMLHSRACFIHFYQLCSLGTGCFLVFLYLAVNLFPVNCHYQMACLLPQGTVLNQVETLCRMSADV